MEGCITASWPLDAPPDNQITWRCVICNRRLGDYIPPVGEAEVVCAHCRTMNTLTIMWPELGGQMTIAGHTDADTFWIVRRGVRRMVWG